MNFLKLSERFVDNAPDLFLLILGLSLIHGFFPLIPIETGLALFIGYLAGIGPGNPLSIWSGLTIGNFVSSMVIYFLVWQKGTHLLEWKFIRSKLSRENIAKTEVWFQKFGVWTLFIGKIIPGMTIVTVFCCGLFRVKRKQAIFAITLSNMLYYCGLVIVCQSIGRQWQSFCADAIEFISWTNGFILMSIVAIVVLCLALGKKYRKPHSKDGMPNQ